MAVVPIRNMSLMSSIGRRECDILLYIALFLR